jgi:hypothetical protein
MVKDSNESMQNASVKSDTDHKKVWKTPELRVLNEAASSTNGAKINVSPTEGTTFNVREWAPQAPS